MLLPLSYAATLLVSRAVAFDLTLTNGDVSPDGHTRRGILLNDKPLGPLITFNKGETFQVNVANKLDDPTMRRSTSIHWHGFFQHKTNAQDGAAFVSQCPIAPGGSFNYSFPIGSQAGTFWYHSHLSTQYCDGLRGPIVIKDPDDPFKDMYNVDDESTVITISDHYHAVAPVAQKGFFISGVPPPPNSTLINGVGRHIGGPAVPWAVVNVEANKKYRLRFINTGCRIPYRVSIQGHNLTIIEADSQPVVPLKVQGFDIFPGQRYSVVLEANQPPDNYWLFGVPFGGGLGNLNPSDGRAILRYAGAPAADPALINQPSLPPFLEQDLKNTPANSPGLGGNVAPDQRIVLNVALLPNSGFFTVNGTSFIPPTLPALLQIISGAKNVEDFIPSEQLIRLERNKLIEVVFPGGGGHPMHLHGHAFDVVRSSNVPEGQANFDNPVRRDVVAMNGGNTTFRFRTDNPGPWFVHCHIDWHLEAGFAVVFGEAPEDNLSGADAQIIPEEWNKLCPAYDDLTPDLQ